MSQIQDFALQTEGFFTGARRITKRFVDGCLLFSVALCLSVAAMGCRKDAASAPKQMTPPPSAPSAPVWLEDVTEKLAVNFVHDVGPVGTYFMPESLGSGVAIFDFDGDGRMDLFLLQNAGTN